MALKFRRPEGEATRQRIVWFILMYRDDHGYAPTVREIAEGVGLGSKATVKRHLDILREDGKVNWEPRSMRTLRVVA